MQEKTILQVSIVVIILGLFFLLLYAQNLDVRNVERIDSEIPEETVLLKGVINRVSQHDKVIFLEMLGERIEKVDIVLFNDEEVFVKEGDYAEITGTVEEYKGKKEIIADKIVLK